MLFYALHGLFGALPWWPLFILLLAFLSLALRGCDECLFMRMPPQGTEAFAFAESEERLRLVDEYMLLERGGGHSHGGHHHGSAYDPSLQQLQQQQQQQQQQNQQRAQQPQQQQKEQLEGSKAERVDAQALKAEFLRSNYYRSFVQKETLAHM